MTAIRKSRGIADGWLLLIVLAGLAGSLWWAYNTVDKRAYQRGKLEVQVEFDRFKSDVAKAGAEAKAKADAEKLRQARVNQERVKGYEKRLADVNSRYQRLLSDNSASSRVPTVPDTARPGDDAARDKRLLEVLRHADEQTAQLIELQEWVREQALPK